MKPKLILAAMILSGSSHVLAAPAPVSDVASSSNTSKIESRLAALENMIKTRNLLQVELQQQLEVLQDEVNQLRGTTEEQGYKIGKMLQRQRELYQEIEDRVSVAYTPVVPTVTEGNDVPQVSISNDLSENEAYDRAVQLIMKDKRYDQAIPEFKSFLTNFPESVYIPNAHYWLGQLLMMKSEVSEAQSHFETVVTGYPDSNKRADAMLKLGTVYQKQNLIVKAKQTLQNLLSEYPDSTAAKLATDRLSKF
ncbi:tol-pal system protein YbgF [Pseudoalteromonas denitrificans]|uniref:Cell division coordinator CpoB n=1 Tax=Pseudoalteromonas denitrificans DSM 6059 TaxID=1123010 RepID=A0A1I1US78_9GAMM|nr:tol-pal system protein YbgF [Pseudoalteromonas denitrificans]SFD73445.1 tol-pal system protein YbgF [Pseudoalteromonas denitrificans DSM 6059]